MARDHNMHRELTTFPLAYFISLRTYGTWLHGDQRGSTDRDHNQYGAPFLPPNPERQQFEQDAMQGPPMILNAKSAALVEQTVREVCAHRGWKLFTVKARTNHLHAIVHARRAPERVMNDFKAWTTRRLRENNFAGKEDSIWAFHGSTPSLWTPEQLLSAIDYVDHRQGPPLSE